MAQEEPVFDEKKMEKFFIAVLSPMDFVNSDTSVQTVGKQKRFIARKKLPFNTLIYRGSPFTIETGPIDYDEAEWCRYGAIVLVNNIGFAIGDAVRRADKNFDIKKTMAYKTLVILNDLYPRSYNLLSFPPKLKVPGDDHKMKTHMDKLIHAIAMKMYCNGFVSSSASFMYNMGSYFDHSCIPNCSSFIEKGVLVVKTIVDVELGAPLTITYIRLFDDRNARMAILKKNYGFTCKCDACIGLGYPSKVLCENQSPGICIMCGKSKPAFSCPVCKTPFCDKTCFIKNMNLVHHSLCRIRVNHEGYDFHSNPIK